MSGRPRVSGHVEVAATPYNVEQPTEAVQQLRGGELPLVVYDPPAGSLYENNPLAFHRDITHNLRVLVERH